MRSGGLHVAEGVARACGALWHYAAASLPKRTVTATRRAEPVLGDLLA